MEHVFLLISSTVCIVIVKKIISLIVQSRTKINVKFFFHFTNYIIKLRLKF